MNDVNEMPPKCRSCPYWEIAEEPYFCGDCEDRTEKIRGEKNFIKLTRQ